MFRLLTGAAVAASLLLAPVAGADPILEGCYGVESVVVCDPTITYTVPAGVELYEDSVHVCAGTCQDHDVTLVRPTDGDGALSACVTTYSESGIPTTRCVTVPDTGPTVDAARNTAADAVAATRYALCDASATFSCGRLIEDAFRILENTLRP